MASAHFLRRFDFVLDVSFIRELMTARYADGQGLAVDRSGSLLPHAVAGYFDEITKDHRLEARKLARHSG